MNFKLTDINIDWKNCVISYTQLKFKLKPVYISGQINFWLGFLW